MKRGLSGVLLSTLWLVSACSSSPTTPSSQTSTTSTPPSSSVQKAISTFLSNVTTSVNATKNGSRSLAGTDANRIAPLLFGPGLTAQCTPSGSSCSVQFNESFNRQDACTNGGASTVSATLTGVLQGNQTDVSGTLNMSTRTTFSGCSENGWLTNSNPSIAANGTLYLTSQHTRLNLTVSGGFVITNAPGTPNGRASCVFNGVLLQWDDITGNWANSGSVDCADGRVFRF